MKTRYEHTRASSEATLRPFGRVVTLVGFCSAESGRQIGSLSPGKG